MRYFNLWVKDKLSHKKGHSICLNSLFFLISVLAGTSTSGYEERRDTDPQTQTQEPQQDPTRWALQLKTLQSFSLGPVTEQIFGALQAPWAVRGLQSLRAALPGPPQRSLATSRWSRTLTACTHTTAHTHRLDTTWGESFPLFFCQIYHLHVCFNFSLQISALPAYMATHSGAIPLKMPPGSNSGSSGSKAEPWNSLILA